MIKIVMVCPTYKTESLIRKTLLEHSPEAQYKNNFHKSKQIFLLGIFNTRGDQKFCKKVHKTLFFSRNIFFQ